MDNIIGLQVADLRDITLACACCILANINVVEGGEVPNARSNLDRMLRPQWLHPSEGPVSLTTVQWWELGPTEAAFRVTGILEAAPAMLSYFSASPADDRSSKPISGALDLGKLTIQVARHSCTQTSSVICLEVSGRYVLPNK